MYGKAQKTASLFLAALLGLVSFLGLSGCSDQSDDDLFDHAEIVNFFLGENTIAVGDGTVLTTEFSFSSEQVFENEESMQVVVRLPAGTGYREGSAEIDTFFGEDTIGPQITVCPISGDTFLLFNIDRYDVREAENPSGNADARLTLTIDGITPLSGGVVEARADDKVLFACELLFLPEAQELIVVTP